MRTPAGEYPNIRVKAEQQADQIIAALQAFPNRVKQNITKEITDYHHDLGRVVQRHFGKTLTIMGLLGFSIGIIMSKIRS